METLHLRLPFGGLRVSVQHDTIVSSEVVLFYPQNVDKNHRLFKPISHFLESYVQGMPNDTWIKPFLLQGKTPFQERLRAYLCSLPFGSVVTYGQVAQALHTSAQAVGQGLRCNPYGLLVPCHRVVAKDGLGGYQGGYKDLPIKEALLTFEQNKKALLI